MTDVKEMKSGFKGLGIVERDFSRTRKKCSEIVKESCEGKDCILEVFYLGPRNP